MKMVPLEDPFFTLRQTKKLTAPLIKQFEALYGDIFFRSLEYLQKSDLKVHKNVFLPSNLEIWVVQGQDGEYTVYPGIFCQCHSFLLDTIYRKRQYFPCKHLLAQKIADALDQFDSQTLKDSEYAKWRK